MTPQMTVTITETDRPSRSKGRGWAYLELEDGERTFASTPGRSITIKAGDKVTCVHGVELRRASGRTDKLRETAIIPTDSVGSFFQSLGSPQSYDISVRVEEVQV